MTGSAYSIAGQVGGGCVDFFKVTVESYNSVYLLLPPPTGLPGAGQQR